MDASARGRMMDKVFDLKLIILKLFPLSLPPSSYLTASWTHGKGSSLLGSVGDIQQWQTLEGCCL
jgi:hypothetical protein